MSYQYKKKGYVVNKVFDRLEAIPQGVSYTVLHNIYKDVTNKSNSFSYNLQNWLSQSIFRKDGRYICRDTRDPNTGRRIYKLCRKDTHVYLPRLFDLHKMLRNVSTEGFSDACLNHYNTHKKFVATCISEAKYNAYRVFHREELVNLNMIHKLYKNGK